MLSIIPCSCEKKTACLKPVRTASPAPLTKEEKFKIQEDIDRAVTLIRRGRQNEALSVTEKLCIKYPGISGVAKIHAIALQKTGRTEEAIDVLKTASSKIPEDFEILDELAVLLLKSGKFEESSKTAMKLWSLLNEKAPSNEDALGKAFLIISSSRRMLPENPITASNYEKVIKYWDHRLEANPKDELLLLSKGAFLRAGGRYDEAMALYETIRETETENLFVPLLIGKTLMEKGDWPGAQRQFEKTLRENKDNFRAYRNLGWFWHESSITASPGEKIRRIQKSVGYYEKARDISPLSVDISFMNLKIAENLYLIWVQTGREKDRVTAVKAFDLYKKNSPEWISTDSAGFYTENLKMKRPRMPEPEDNIEIEIHPVVK